MTHQTTPPVRVALVLGAALAALSGLSQLALAQEAPAPAEAPTAPSAPPIPPPITVARLTGEITLDGSLDEPAWQSAAVVDQFFETFPADNTEPAAKTVVYLAYDDKYFYIGVHAFDPHPEQIRAPYVERDTIFGTDDNLAVFLDTRNDRRSALELRINPRGDQGDAIYDDGTGNEDFSLDTFYDTAATLTADGWTGEYRIPFSSLRYPKVDEVKWGILIWRNYPRDQRYGYYSSPIPRGSNCTICRSREINGLTNLPEGGHYVAAPYATGRRVDETGPGGLGSSLSESSNNFDVGGDFKWTPSASNALDATINPDFSQIESDVGQIPTNNQFALFFPEKRPFFLEGLDLFDTPIQAVYTRSINDPRWGVRDTGKMGSTSFTALITQDRGGGGVILPGPTGSGIAFQDFASKNFIGRARRDFGASFAGLLVTARQNDDGDGGGYNRVIGPDFNYRWSDTDQLTGQLLFSQTETPVRTDLTSRWDGSKLSSHAGTLEWLHTGRDWTWRLTGRDYGDEFRADLGFLPQVGIRLGRFALFRNYYPKGKIRRAQPYVVFRHIESQHGDEVERLTVPGFQVMGTHNLFANVELSVKERRLVRGRLIESTHVSSNMQIDPGRRFSRIGWFLNFGDAIDFRGAREGHGGEVFIFGTVKPTDHLVLDFQADRQWLDLDDAGRKGRLFTAQIERLKATYNFNARSFVRLIGEHFDQDSNVALYAPVAADPHQGSFNGSALFAYRLNWQTVFFLGFGDDREQDFGGKLQPLDRAYFLKISYAFQG